VVVGLLDYFVLSLCCTQFIVAYVAYAICVGDERTHRPSSSQLHSRSKQAFHSILCALLSWSKPTFKRCQPILREILTLFEVKQLNHLFASLFQPPEIQARKKRRKILGYPVCWMILSEIQLHPTVCARHGFRTARRNLPTFQFCDENTWQIVTPRLFPTRQPTNRPPFQPTFPSCAFDFQLRSQLPYKYQQNDSAKLHFVCSEPQILSTNQDNEYSSLNTIVLDTGSSFSLTPFEDDLVYVLKEGDLGTVSTVDDSKIKMTKLGYAEYFVRDTKGNDVPFYPIVFVVPGTTQRLLSPQDYSRCLPWRDDQYIEEFDPDMYGGTHNYTWFALNENWDYAGCGISPRSNLPHFQIRRRSPSDPPRTFHPRYTRAEAIKVDEEEESFTGLCDCKDVSGPAIQTMTTYSEQNTHLTPAQRTLLLWHNRLGHRGFQHVQRLFSACDSSKGTPFNTSDCAPCLPLPSGLTKSLVNKCSVPLCLACELAKATKKGPDLSWSQTA
jgi:hypothetical protein